MERQWTAAAYRAFPGKVESGFPSMNAISKERSPLHRDLGGAITKALRNPGLAARAGVFPFPIAAICPRGRGEHFQDMVKLLLA
jgi:hypothetical protein